VGISVFGCDVHRNVGTLHRAVMQLVEDVVFVAVVMCFTGFVGQVRILKATVRVADR